MKYYHSYGILCTSFERGGTLRTEARKKAENAFTVGVFLIVVLRFALAFASFGDKGVNPYVFAALDLLSAWPYARYTAKVVIALADYDYSRLARDGALWAFWFLLPYLYLFFAASNVPVALWLGVGLWMGVFGIAAVVGMIRKARKQRATHA